MVIPWLEVGQSIICGLTVYVIYFVLMLLGTLIGRFVPAVGRFMDSFNPRVESFIVNILFVLTLVISAYYWVLPKI